MEAVTVSEGQKQLEAILPALEAAQTFKQNSYSVRSNWASKLGGPCERYLYHLRADWDKAEVRDWKGMGELGNLIADHWIRRMSEKGFKILHQELALRDDIARTYQIGGRIDCRISHNGSKPIIAEIKSMNARDWEKINSEDDIRESKTEWIVPYYGQLQIYMLSENEEVGLFVIISKSTLETKLIPIWLDMGYCEWLLKRAERINKAFAEKKPLERIPYSKTCKRCEFRVICLPDLKNEGLDFIDNQELEAILKERDTLEESAEKWEELDKHAKDIAKTVGKDFIVGESYKVEFKNSTMKRVDTKSLPPDVRLKYEVETPIQKISFVPLGG